MMNKVYNYVASFGSLIERPLRRSIQDSVRYSAMASQFTQSEAKGRTLVRPVLYSAIASQFTRTLSRAKWKDRTLLRSIRYSTCKLIHPLPGGAADFTTKEKINGVGQHNTSIN